MVDESRAAPAHPASFPAWARTLLRILRLWRYYAEQDFLWTLRDVPSMLIFLSSNAIVALGTVTGTFLLAERFGGIGHWSKYQVIFMLGYALLVTGLPEIFFAFNVSFISRRIGRGQFDHTLIQPQPIWMSLMTEGFAPFSAAMDFVPGTALVVWSATQLNLPITPGWLALLALNLVASTAIGLAYAFIWGSLAFWAPRGAEEINSSTWALLSQLKGFPLDGVAPALLGGLLTVVPVGFLAWFPARALLGLEQAPLAIVVTPLAAAVFCALAVWVFQRGLKQYGRTGSQRYLAYGHRR